MFYRCIAWIFLLPLCAVSVPAQGITPKGEQVDVFGSTGKTAVLFFLRSDCPVSNLYAPEITRLADVYRKQGVRFWLVFPDNSDHPADVARDVEQYYAGTPLEKVVLRDPDHALVKAAGVDMMPEAAVFRGHKRVYEGRIDNKVAGLGQYRVRATEHDLDDAIQAALASRPAAPAGGPAYGCYIADAQ